MGNYPEKGVKCPVARNMYDRLELDYLIYNAPLEYADLILNCGSFFLFIRTIRYNKVEDNRFGNLCIVR